jgi:hypothetical protein
MRADQPIVSCRKTPYSRYWRILRLTMLSFIRSLISLGAPWVVYFECWNQGVAEFENRTEGRRNRFQNSV